MSLFEHQTDRAAALAEVPFLSSLTREDLNRMALTVTDMEAGPGRVLIEQGQPGSSLFILISGRVSVARDRREIATRGPGEFVGELSLLLGEPCNATVTAVEDCRLLVLERRAFNALLDSAPSLTKRLLQDLARRFRETNEA